MLYRGNLGVADAVTELNQIVVQYKLLSGFATVCVGIYDCVTRHLSDVSCGHEPAIVLRSVGGSPRILSTTSAAIGVFADEQFEAGEVTMGPGDLLCFTQMEYRKRDVPAAACWEQTGSRRLWFRLRWKAIRMQRAFCRAS